ncbi:MAG: GGDEF domain-containing protein [Candidatus Pacearchaeota archaeon]|nr:MAG: GGDEF domain-containing protein [Candidatus Pacearchaeota archaeon]
MKKRKGKKEKRYAALEQLSKQIRSEIKKPKPEARSLGRLFNELYSYATKDHLTGVFNRRILDELLGREMEKSIRQGLPLAVIMMDIDNFKQYNDTYGHLQGDMALKAATKTIQRLTRKEDFVARYGGEEFIIVLPNTKLKKAREIAERIRKKIAETKIRAISKRIEKGFEKVTVSMGISKLTKAGIQYMLDQADIALYKAKEKGKNKVCVIE